MINTINMLALCFMFYFIACTFGADENNAIRKRDILDNSLNEKIENLDYKALTNCIYDHNLFRMWWDEDINNTKKCLQEKLDHNLLEYIREEKLKTCIDKLATNENNAIRKREILENEAKIKKIIFDMSWIETTKYNNVMELSNCIFKNSIYQEIKNHNMRVIAEIDNMYINLNKKIEQLNVMELSNCIFNDYNRLKRWSDEDINNTKKCLQEKMEIILSYYTGKEKLNTCIDNLQNSDIFGSLNTNLLKNMIKEINKLYPQSRQVEGVKFYFKSYQGTEDKAAQEVPDPNTRNNKRPRVTIDASVDLAALHSKLENLNIQSTDNNLDKNRDEDSELWEYTNFLEIKKCLVYNEIKKKADMNQLNMCIFTIKLKTCIKEGVNLELTRESNEASLNACLHDMHVLHFISQTHTGYINAFLWHNVLHDLTRKKIIKFQKDFKGYENVGKALIAYKQFHAIAYAEDENVGKEDENVGKEDENVGKEDENVGEDIIEFVKVYKKDHSELSKVGKEDENVGKEDEIFVAPKQFCFEYSSIVH